jgi:hypothetical protein
MDERVRAGLGGLVVGLIALLALGAGVLHADQGETRLTSAHAIVQAERSNAYYACLNAQAHSLVGPHDVVYLDRPTLSEWVTLTKVLGGLGHRVVAPGPVHRGRGAPALPGAGEL